MVRRLQAKTPLWISIKTPLLIIQIFPKYHPNNIQKSSRYHPHITHISSIYHPHIVQISPGQYFLQPPNLVKSRVLTQIWHDYCRKKLHFEIRLKLHFSSSRYYPNINQISFRNYPEIIQSTSILQFPQLVKSRVFIQIWHNYCRWKLHFWKARVEFYLILTQVFVC